MGWRFTLQSLGPLSLLWVFIFGLYTTEHLRLISTKEQIHDLSILRQELEKEFDQLAHVHIVALQRISGALVDTGTDYLAFTQDDSPSMPQASNSTPSPKGEASVGKKRPNPAQEPSEIASLDESPPSPPSPITLLSINPQRYASTMHRHLARLKDRLNQLNQQRPLAGPDQKIRIIYRSFQRLGRDIDTIADHLSLFKDSIGQDNQATAHQVWTGLNHHSIIYTQDLQKTRRQTLSKLSPQSAKRQSYWSPPFFLQFLSASLMLLLALWLSHRPIKRLCRLIKTQDTPEKSKNGLEIQLVRVLERHRKTRLGLEKDFLKMEADTQRWQQKMRRCEQELALLKIYAENLVNSLSAALIVTDTAGRIASFNRSARDTFSLTGETLSRKVKDLPIYQALSVRSTNISLALAQTQDGKPYKQEAVAYACPADTPVEKQRLMDITVVPYLDESGSTRGYLWLVDDVTASVRTKNQLLAAEHLATVGRMSAQVAHEIRNPLSAIGLNTELLLEELEHWQEKVRLDAKDTGLFDEARALIQATGSEVERLSLITEGYLELARLPLPQCVQSELNQLVGDLFAMLRNEMDRHHINIEFEFATPSPTAWVDPGQIRQAMLNVVQNSRDAMPKGGRLSIKTYQDHQFSFVEFRDSGIGVPQDTLHRVFEPFYTTKPDGTGLGLSLTEQIMAEHQGEIALLPDSHGTLVRLTMPSSVYVIDSSNQPPDNWDPQAEDDAKVHPMPPMA
jgi:nitrogen fixation/metabolism regulation signal transduction histidine kinase